MTLKMPEAVAVTETKQLIKPGNPAGLRPDFNLCR